jgi:uncharacterized lipoprotein YmbA
VGSSRSGCPATSTARSSSLDCPGELRIDEFLRWAERSTRDHRTVAENLDALLPESHVVRAPWAAKAQPRCRVWLQLDLFGPQAGGEVRLEGRWAGLPSREAKPLATKAFDLRRGPLAGGAKGPPDASTGVDAMSELLADLSREIAAAVRALPPEAGGEGR